MPITLSAPIPGESLTREPGNSPWEQPPQYTDPNQVLGFYFQRIEDEEFMDDLLFILDKGMPLSVFVESMMTMGVMEGIHTIDVSMLVAPIIHEYILNLAKAADIKVVEDESPTKEEKMAAKTKQRFLLSLDELFNTDDNEPAVKETAPNGIIPRRR